MDVLVMDSDFKYKYIIDHFRSLIWTDRYWECGDFEFYVEAESENIKKFEMGDYVQIQESERTMIVENIEITTDIEEGNFLKVSGRSLESILDRRIIWQTFVYENGSLQTCIKNILNDAFISPSISARKVSNFKFSSSSDSKITSLEVEQEWEGDNVYDVICDLCKTNSIGFKILLDSSNNFVFSLYAGADRGWNQTDNGYTIFSERYENLISTEYIESEEDYKNYLLIKGETVKDEETEEETTFWTTYGESKTGIDRREAFYNSSTSRPEDDDGNDVSDTTYESLLQSEGKTELEDYKKLQDFDAEVDSNISFIYNEDYFVGDIVDIESPYEDLLGQARVIEGIVSYDSGGKTVYATFEMIDDD